MIKVGLVEDNEINRSMVARRLTKKGYLVITAADGMEAIRMAKIETPDIILMDLNLPVISGVEAAREIRATTSLKNIPIVALTAHPADSQNGATLDCGWDEYVTKPIEFPVLLDKINRLLANRQIANQSALNADGLQSTGLIR